MRARNFIVSASLLVPVVGAQEEPPRFQLPKDPKAIVLSLDYVGGFTPPRKTEDPYLRVLADGTMIAPPIFQEGEARTGKLSADELQTLLRFVVEEQKLLAWDAEAVQRDIRKRQVPMLADASSTVVFLQLKDRKVEASQYALGMYVTESSPFVKEGEAIPALVRLYAVERRLMHWHAIVLGGDPERVKGLLARLNQQRSEGHAEGPAFRLEDLTKGMFRPNGIQLYFERSQDGGRWRGDVQVPVEGKPTFHAQWWKNS
ncbi:MAG: hypothetical protein H6833_13690 [Planctomycetes bacterium]|nr:hypothetical protein [Planctomycetota bacterium]